MSNIEQLGHLVFEVADLTAWESFATRVLGLEVARRWRGGLSLRMDSHAQRLFLQEGPADDLDAIGWQVSSAPQLKTLADKLDAVGVANRFATDDECAARQVDSMVVAHDPSGIRLELYAGPTMGCEPFASPLVPGGFIADNHGLGHLVISAPDEAATRRFYCELLGFSLSDRIVCKYYGHPVDITFLHVNPRHHSLAFGGAQAKRLHHFLLEVSSIDEVGAAFDRVLRHRSPVAQTIGRHPNDHMISFYAHTPSGFQFEYGCGGLMIDRENWTPAVLDRISDWGHHPPAIVGRAAAKPVAPKPSGAKQ